MPQFSVIIPAWNGEALLPACLEALARQTEPALEVIVVDNASSDGTAALVAERYPQVRLLRQAQNLGFAGGCNVGLRAARGDSLVLLNQDTVPETGWLEALRTGFEQQPQAGVIGCKTLFAEGQTLQHAGAYLDWPLALAHHYGSGQRDGPDWSTARPVEYVTGAALAMRRAVLDRVGLLDDGFWPGYFEDADFCLRAREAGFEIWYWPAARLVHLETVSTADPLQRSRFYQRGRLRFLMKHLRPQRLLAEWLPAELAYQPPAIAGNESQAVRLAYLEAILAAPQVLAERWSAAPDEVEKVVGALQRLYQQAWQVDWQAHEDQALAAPGAPVGLAGTPLREFEFPANRPVVGRLVARLQSMWYSVAARWGVRFLAHQQTAINQEQDLINRQNQSHIAALARRQAQMAEEHALLARALAMRIREQP